MYLISTHLYARAAHKQVDSTTAELARLCLESDHLVEFGHISWYADDLHAGD